MQAMTSTTTAVLAQGLDGPIDRGLEQDAQQVVRDADERRGAGGGLADVGAEAAAHSLLRMVGDHPGQMGRMRAARLVGGYRVPHRDERDAEVLGRFAVHLEWPLREIVRLVDSMIQGGLVTQTVGPRPVLVLTRAGFQALIALESAPVRG